MKNDERRRGFALKRASAARREGKPNRARGGKRGRWRSVGRERRNRNREDGGGLAASGAVADSRRDAGDSRLWCPVIPGPPPTPPPSSPGRVFLLPRSPPSVFDTARRLGRMPAGRGAQSRGKYSNRSRCAVRINIISHRERSERAMPGSGFRCTSLAPGAAHARTHEISQPRLSISGDASIDAPSGTVYDATDQVAVSSAVNRLRSVPRLARARARGTRSTSFYRRTSAMKFGRCI